MNQDLVTLRVTHRFKASPERVFDAWLDPAKAARFLFATPTGQIVRAEIDARVGGRVRVRSPRRRGHRAHRHLSRDRPPAPPGLHLRRAEILGRDHHVKHRDRGARHRLRAHAHHEGVLQEWAERTEGGWRMILEGLAKTVDG